MSKTITRAWSVDLALRFSEEYFHAILIHSSQYCTYFVGMLNITLQQRYFNFKPNNPYAMCHLRRLISSLDINIVLQCSE